MKYYDCDPASGHLGEKRHRHLQWYNRKIFMERSDKICIKEMVHNHNSDCDCFRYYNYTYIGIKM